MTPNRRNIYIYDIPRANQQTLVKTIQEDYKSIHNNDSPALLTTLLMTLVQHLFELEPCTATDYRASNSLKDLTGAVDKSETYVQRQPITNKNVVRPTRPSYLHH